ncbi:glycosyltransferase [Pelagibacterales bacterium SAG-MED10]|nr:glycosyltransferase [Pelagibacterales bacterium SAG-MED10]
MKKYSIIIPTLNERDNILNIIKEIDKNLFVKYEIIFADDNSKDGTIDILKKIKNKNVKYIINRGSNNLSKSVILAAYKSRYENLIIMDADLQHDPKYINKLIEVQNKKNRDIVVACRDFEKITGLSPIRITASKILTQIIFFTLGKIIPDPMSGFFLIKRKILIKSIPRLYAKGFKILIDLISVNKTCNIGIIRINFKNRAKHKSKMDVKVLLTLINFIIKKFFRLV